jgi:hypothetical protein
MLITMAFDLGDAGSVVAALVAIIALWFARRSARASERSATASTVSADAAQETARLTRAMRQHAERPVFSMSAEELVNGVLHITIRMEEGPSEIFVSAEYTASVWLSVEPEQLLRAQRFDSPGSFSCGLVKNDAFTLEVEDIPSAAESVEVKVSLLCEDETEDRQWHHIENVEWPPPVDRDAKEQAALVTIAVSYTTPGPTGQTYPAVTITNDGKNPVRQPQIESMGQAHVRSGHQGLVDEEGEEYWTERPLVLQPREVLCVPFQHFNASGGSINLADAFFDETFKYIRPNDVTITFVDLSSVQWRRTGNGETVHASYRSSQRR